MMTSAVAMLYDFNYYNRDLLLEKMNIPVVELLKVRYIIDKVITLLSLQIRTLVCWENINNRMQKPQHIPTKLSTRCHPHFSILTTDDIYYSEG